MTSTRHPLCTLQHPHTQSTLPRSTLPFTPFTFDGFTYHCSEQFIQKKKAKLFKDKPAVKRIEAATTGLKCKQEGGKVTNYKKSSWEKRAKTLCKPGIKQKFLENRHALNTLLLETGNKTIVECTKDTVWGCGLTLQDENCLRKTKWTNQGIMGEILQEIRDNLRHLTPDSTPSAPSDTGGETDSDDSTVSTKSINESSTDDSDSDIGDTTTTMTSGNIDQMECEPSGPTASTQITERST